MPARKKDSFETQLAALEAIVAELDEEDVPLERAIEAYEAGVMLSVTLNKTLEEAQRKIEILTRNARGEFESQPFDEDENE